MRNLRLPISILMATFLLVMSLAIPVHAEIPVETGLHPDTLNATMSPGDSITVTKTLIVEVDPSDADVVFAFDLTGSMGPILAQAKAQAANIISQLDAATDIDINYGVMSYMDYPSDYDAAPDQNCEYAAETDNPYGYDGDLPYILNQAVTSGTPAVISAINSLTLGLGGDEPECHSRVFYESYSDPSVNWRPSAAKKILINFSDTIPHDCDINEGVPGMIGIRSTGGDPGRNAILGDGDDLDLQTVLAGMDSNGITLLACQTNGIYLDYWSHWAGLTSGAAYDINIGTFADDVVAAIMAGLHDIDLEVTEVVIGPQSVSDWVTFDRINDIQFDETITVPPGTAAGVYEFTVSAVDQFGIVYGTQACTITVVPAPGASSITILKETDPDGTVQYFDFTGDLGDFYLSDGEMTMFDNITADSYTITETNIPANWSIKSIDCPNGTCTRNGNSVTVELGEREDVMVIFTNKNQGDGPNPIPGITEWGILGMIATLAVSAVLVMRRRSAIGQLQ